MHRDAGDPVFGAYFPEIPGNKALPSPSPTANPVGFWRYRCLSKDFSSASLLKQSKKNARDLQN